MAFARKTGRGRRNPDHGDTATLPQSRDYLAGDTPNQAIIETLSVTLGSLAEANAGAPMSQWTRPVDTIKLSVQGLGPGGKFAYQDRGSWIEVVEYLPAQ